MQNPEVWKEECLILTESFKAKGPCLLQNQPGGFLYRADGGWMDLNHHTDTDKHKKVVVVHNEPSMLGLLGKERPDAVIC